MKYFYRSEPVESLKSIKKYGFLCGNAQRIGWGKNESEAAKENGWPIPQQEELSSPRIYLWKQESHLVSKYNAMPVKDLWYHQAMWLQKQFKYVCLPIRFPAFLFPQDRIFPDGCIGDQTAIYVIFPKNKVGDCVVASNQIEVRKGSHWYKIGTFFLISSFFYFQRKQRCRFVLS